MKKVLQEEAHFVNCLVLMSKNSWRLGLSSRTWQLI